MPLRGACGRAIERGANHYGAGRQGHGARDEESEREPSPEGPEKASVRDLAAPDAGAHENDEVPPEKDEEGKRQSHLGGAATADPKAKSGAGIRCPTSD